MKLMVSYNLYYVSNNTKFKCFILIYSNINEIISQMRHVIIQFCISLMASQEITC